MTYARAVNAHETLPSPVMHTITAREGWLLRVWDFVPTSGRAGGSVRGVVIASHAMMVDSRTLCRPDRPTLVAVLVAAGFRVLVPDLRGHGESGPRPAEGGDWTFDELVGDVDHYVELASVLEPERPLVFVGHCMFAKIALAWLGQNPDARVSAFAALSVAVWNRRFEPSLWRWMLGRAGWLLGRLLAAVIGYVPARRLRLGSADVGRSYWRQYDDQMRRNRWDSLDGRIDYYAGLAKIRVPVLHLLSEGDWLFASPKAGVRFSATIPERELLVLGRDDAPGELRRLRPGHMATVTDPRSKLAWHWVAGWLERTLERGIKAG